MTLLSATDAMKLSIPESLTRLTSAILLLAVMKPASAETAPADTAAALNNLALIEHRRGHSEAQGALLKQAYDILEQNNALSTGIAGLVLCNMGLYAEQQARYKEAQEAYRRALPLIRETSGEQSEQFAKLLKNWALLSLETGQLQDALDKDNKAIAIERQLPFINASDKAITLNNLGLVLASLQRFPAAEKAYTEALNLRKDNPAMQVDQAKTLSNLAMLEKDEGHLEAAQRHATQALGLVENARPTDDTAIASILNTMGLISLAENKLNEAKSSFEKAKALWIETVGAQHPSYAATLSNLGAVESRQGRHKKAQAMFETALAIDEARLGPTHPQVASNLTNL
jgi:tetratricopeptide (TPR) repeat protein